MRVFLVRHGQSEANLNKTYSGQSDTKLTERGCQQAAEIALVLRDIPFDKVYSSDLRRAIDTQKTALPGCTAELSSLLREVDVGNIVGKSIPEFWAKYGGVSQTANFGDYTPYGGENRQMLDARIRKFMDMLEQQPYENVAVFAHRGVQLSFLRHVLGGDAVRTDAIKCTNCAIHVLEFDGKAWRICALNYMKKL